MSARGNKHSPKKIVLFLKTDKSSPLSLTNGSQ